MQIVFLDRETFPAEIDFSKLDKHGDLVTYDRTTADDVADRISLADVVITNKVPVTAGAIGTASRLRLVAVAATGYDVVDCDACSERGITVCNIRNYAVNTVPEHTFALILALRRSITAYDRSVREGDWQKAGQFCYFDYPINDLAGSTLGVIGDGVIGQAVADIGRAFRMRVLFSAYKGSTGMGPLYTRFDEVLAQSDVITLHSPLLASTRNMIGADEFALMERSPLLINTARGGLVDELALCRALESGQIAGAGFDVATTEPPAADHPFMKLHGLPNFILTPHVAWASREAMQSLADQLIDNVSSFLSDTPRNVVNSPGLRPVSASR